MAAAEGGSKNNLSTLQDYCVTQHKAKSVCKVYKRDCCDTFWMYLGQCMYACSLYINSIMIWIVSLLKNYNSYFFFNIEKEPLHFLTALAFVYIQQKREGKKKELNKSVNLASDREG